MKKLIILFPIILYSCQPASQKNSEPGNELQSTFYDNVSITRDVAYASDDTTQQLLDIYRQGNRIGESQWFDYKGVPPCPTLIHIHGGGWLGGDKADNPFIYSYYLQRGWNVISLNYRMGPGTAPDAAEDVICALRWIADRKDSLNIDDSRIYVTGGSAGGHLSLVTGMAPGSGRQFNCDVSDVRIRGIINFYGITHIKSNEAFLESTHPDWNYTITWIGDRSRIDDISDSYSPVHYITATTPPVLTIHGALDSVVPYQQATLLHEKLVESSIRNRLVTIDQGNHGGFGNAEYERVENAITDFIEEIESN